MERVVGSSRMPKAHTPPHHHGSLNSALRRNLEALRERRRQELEHSPLQERIARAIGGFAGSMTFVYLHLALYGAWVLANLGWIPGIDAWDPSFVMLAMIASVEAIFLSTFILINQNRMALQDDRRAELDVQISLLSEAEITKLVEMVSAIAERLDVAGATEPEVDEMKKRVAPEDVLDAIEDAEEESSGL